MVRITTDIRNKMVAMRKAGATYVEIETELKVSRWTTINYLKDIEVNQSHIEVEWKKAEREAQIYLKEKGFVNIHDINKICASPYWDILAQKDNKWWVIDVTISEGKKIGAKIPFTIKGYKHAILHRNINTNEWKLISINFEEL